MLTLIIGDAELETIPKEMLDDYAIRKYARSKKRPPREVILDSNYMHSSIDRFFPGESTRRGRPDIIYILLQVVMESILNKKGGLKVFIHTRSDQCISVNPAVRLPKAYNRFIGIFEALFRNGDIRSNETILLSTQKMGLRELIEREKKGDLVIFSPSGEKKRLDEIIRGEADCTVLIGGFSEGDFRSEVYDLARSYSIYPDELTIWSVAGEVIAQYERSSDLI